MGVEDSYGSGWVDVVYARGYFFPPSGPRLRLPSLCRVWFFVRASLQLCRMLLLAARPQGLGGPLNAVSIVR